MTRDMLDHLGVMDTVDVSMEQGRIVIKKLSIPAPGRTLSFEEAK